MGTREEECHIDQERCMEVYQVWPADVGRICWEVFLSRAKKSQLLDKQKRVVGLEKVVDFFQKSLPSVVEYYDCQLLNNGFCLTGGDQQKEPA